MLRIVETENGTLRGLPGSDPRVTAFKGIPFAAPPVGKNRWRAPQPCENWEGVRDAFTFGPISMQDQPGIGGGIYDREWHVDPDIPMSEDCLYLNVWTGAKSADEKRPVLVWIFGGGFQWGYTSEMEFDGERLARRGVVVVSVAYRLGAFGFLAHPQISAQDPQAPGNFGLLDQQAGLRWVKRNIAAFGGDPDQITIAGQSAGGGSVMSQLTCEENFDLIKGAVILSGMFRRDKDTKDDLFRPLDLAGAEKKGEDFLSYLGVSDIEEARELDAFYIRDRYAAYAADHPRMFPFTDGVFAKEDAMTRFIEGKRAWVPVMAGNTDDEFRVGEINSVEKSVKTAFAEAQEKRPDSPPMYYYRFEPDIPGWDKPGSFHSVDLWFFFETIGKCWRPFKGRHFDLARQMCDYFANFIKTGDPNGPGWDQEPLPAWLPYAGDPTAAEKKLNASAAVCLGGGLNPDAAVLDLSAQDGSLPGENVGITGRTEMIFGSAGAHSQKERPGFGKRLAFNPYLPSWEYIPDGEPYVFGDRVYVYGSHDLYDGETFCMGDYVCWSAPVDDLASWRYEGVIYPKTADPLNPDGHMCLYAPDVTQGPDGRYYLYYVLDKVCVVSVAVCDTPAGRYEFYGYVHDKNGVRLGEREGDEPQFDPGVLTEGDETYLYTGFCGIGDKSRHGAMLTVLEPDMLTIREEPVFIAPGKEYSDGTGYEGHAYFEAASIRKRGDLYYFIYSSEVMHELCYALGDNPRGPFTYGGVLVSNCDLQIDTYKKAGVPSAYGANNHGSMVQIQDDWYIFYHRHTNGTWFSRQGCAEKLTFTPDGHVIQAEMTSCGLNGGPLPDVGEYPAYIACNLFTEKHAMYVEPGAPRVVQSGGEGQYPYAYIRGITDGTTIGFKYFECAGVRGVRIKTRAYAHGFFEIRSVCDQETEPLGKIRVDGTNLWTIVECRFDAGIWPDGAQALYLTFRGTGGASLLSVEFLH